MAQYAISGFDRRSVLPTRAHPEFSVACLKDCFRNVVVKGTPSVGVEYLCRSKLHPALMICFQDNGHSLV
eukprot:7036306-Pyramimonas_sp.AAC.1